jgi:hypothetical protein
MVLKVLKLVADEWTLKRAENDDTLSDHPVEGLFSQPLSQT